MKMKKIIAREFLIFLGAIISFFLLFFSWNLYQINSWKKLKLLQKELANSSTNNLEKRQELYRVARDLVDTDSFFLYVSTEEKILYLLIFIFSILFLMRYIFYAIKWSIIQLKEK
jgi:ABC-type antimicrobial peptide transport system permease subunit